MSDDVITRAAIGMALGIIFFIKKLKHVILLRFDKEKRHDKKVMNLYFLHH